MILGSNIQKVYLGNQEVSKIFLQNFEIFSLSPSILTDPYSDYVTLLTHFDTNFSDSSTNNIQLTVNGNTQISTSIKKFGSGAAFFDGAGDFLSTTSQDSFKFSGDFTIEMWIYPLSFNTRMTLFDNAAFVTGLGINFVTLETTGFYQIQSVSQVIGTSNTSPNLNQWNHVALVRRNSIIKIYNNGIEVLSVNNQDNFNSGACIIGVTFPPNLNDTVWGFNGYIDDYRITNGIARYASNFTPPAQQLPDPTDPYINNVSLLLHMDGTNGSQTFVDSSSNNFTLSVFGNTQISTSVKRLGSGSAVFDGSGDYLRINSNTAFGLGNNFTIEAWVYPTAMSLSDLTTIVDLRDGSIQHGTAVFLESSTRKVFFYDGPANNVLLTNGTIPLNTWTHIAAVRNGTTWQVYINGILDSATYTSSSNLNAARTCFIGTAADGPGTLRNFTGYIDELRITKGITRYTSNFVPQTAPFANPVSYDSFIQNLLAYWSFDDSSFQPSFGIYSAVLDGGSWTVTADSVYNLAARLAPNQRIRVVENLWNVRTNPLSFSVSFWVRKNANNTSGQEAVMLGNFFGDMGFAFHNQTLTPGNINNAFSFILPHGSAQGQFIEFRAAEVLQTMNLNQWYHLVGTYNLAQQTAKLYINGQLVATNSNILNNACPNANWTGFAMNGSVVGTTGSEYGNNYTFDMVGLWSRLLTDTEVEQLYLNYKPINDFII